MHTLRVVSHTCLCLLSCRCPILSVCHVFANFPRRSVRSCPGESLGPARRLWWLTRPTTLEMEHLVNNGLLMHRQSQCWRMSIEAILMLYQEGSLDFPSLPTSEWVDESLPTQIRAFDEPSAHTDMGELSPLSTRAPNGGMFWLRIPPYLPQWA
jgi:hypothetical protein